MFKDKASYLRRSFCANVIVFFSQSGAESVVFAVALCLFFEVVAGERRCLGLRFVVSLSLTLVQFATLILSVIDYDAIYFVLKSFVYYGVMSCIFAVSVSSYLWLNRN